RQSTPDASLSRLIRPTAVAECRPDKAFTPHPAINAGCVAVASIRPTAVAECRPDKAFTPHPAINA
ncbi:TPA: hypothetical protein ACWMHZ_000722, partial [Escherichia coli]